MKLTIERTGDIKMAVFWVVMPYSLVEMHQCLEVFAVSSSEQQLSCTCGIGLKYRLYYKNIKYAIASHWKG